MDKRDGTTRTVVVHAGIAVKFAKGEVGRRCNLRESDLWNRYHDHPHRGPLLCPVLWCAPDGAVLVMKEAQPVGPEFRFDDLPDWDYLGPGDDGCPFEPKSRDWGILDGRLVAVDYSVDEI